MTDRVSQSLREVVAGRVDARWEAWAKQHPHLAQAIDRARLIDTTVSRLRDDPAFNAALARAGLDEARLIDAARAIEHAERLIGRLLRL